MNSSNLLNEKYNATFALSDLFIFLWHKKIRVTLTVIIIVSLGSYYIFKLPKYYRATSTILLDGNSQQSKLPISISSLSNTEDTQFETYVEFIKSRKFLLTVINELDLTKYEEFRSKKIGVSNSRHIDYAVSEFLHSLSLNRVGETYMLRVSYESSSPELAVEIVNYLGPAFFEFQNKLNQQKVKSTSIWLNSQISELQNKLSVSEENLRLFLEQHQLVDVQGQLKLVGQEVSSLMLEKLTNEKLLFNIRETAQQIKTLQDSNFSYENIASLPWFLANPILAEVRERINITKISFIDISKRYKEKHHKFIAALAALNALKEEQVDLTKKLIISVESNLHSLESRNIDLDKQLILGKEKYTAFGRHEIRLNKLKREVETTQRLYETFLARLREAEFLKDLDKNEDFTVVDIASTPASPSKPRVTLLLAGLGLCSIFISVAFWLIIHLISDKQTRFRQLLRKLDVPLLAEIPKIKGSNNTKNIAKTLGQGEQDYLFTEAIRSLRTAISMRPDESGCKTIAVTGIQDGDGKTTISVSLALAFAKLERVILIDSDLRMPSIAKVFGLAKEQPGLSNFISQRAKFSDCLFRQPDTRLNVLPSGPIPNDPMIHISNPRFAKLIKKLSEIYERVVLEAPSVNTVSDALVISKHVDGVILVCDIEKLNADSLLEAVQRLRENGAPLLGVVFNKVKPVNHRRRKEIVPKTHVVNKP